MPSWFQNDTQFPSLGVYESWLLGFTGEGVHVTVLDDGVEPDHPDLVANYVSLLLFCTWTRIFMTDIKQK